MNRTLARRFALGVALALACSTAEAQAVTQHGAVQTPGGVQLQIQPGTIFNYACNGGSGGIVGETYNGVVCALPGSGSSAWSVYAADGGNNALLTNSLVQIASGAHTLYGEALWNSNSSDVWCQAFDALAANVTLGTTKPKFSWRIPGGSSTNAGAWEEKYVNGLSFSTAVTVACTTTATGSTAPDNGVQANFYYQ